MQTLDANGNPVSTVGEYEYDGDGKRVKKHVPSTGEVTVFVYDAGGKLIGEYSTVAAPQSPQVSYTTADHLGSPRILTDQNGTTISRRDFMPYGEEIARSAYGSDTVRQKFTTYERDGETDLDYAQARLLNYGQGRFSSPDPFLSSGTVVNPQTWNRYVYVSNNPVTYVDPFGLYAWSRALGGSASDDALRQQITGIQADGNISDEEKTAKIAAINDILTKRAQFRASLSRLADIVLRADISDSFRRYAAAILLSYGTENDGNNVLIALRTNEDAPAFTREDNGRVVVAVAASAFSNKSFAFTLFHEGTHIAQINAWNYAKQSGFEINPATVAAEFEAYYNAAALVRGLDSAFVNNETPEKGPESYSITTGQGGGTTLWQRGWTEVEMRSAITTHLRNLGYIDGLGRTTDRGASGAFPGGGRGQWK
ncbi:MAG: RHS repeat-associated core domain-containing protein [Acidobacteria bacterium]|nr:RHS repeat-associated core domain-containing protein [Acidobacteriota bacterium]